MGCRGLIQGNGLGKRLLRSVEKFGHKLGLNAIFVNASPGARTYFKKQGYSDANFGFLKKDIKTKKLLTIPYTQMGRGMALEAF